MRASILLLLLLLLLFPLHGCVGGDGLGHFSHYGGTVTSNQKDACSNGSMGEVVDVV